MIGAAKIKAAPLWTPASISTQAWFDAWDLPTIVQATTGGLVSQWTDKSTNNKHFLQAAAGNQPTTGVETISGINALGFNGSAYFMRMGSNPFGASISNAALFIVLNIKTIATSTLFSLTGSTTGANRWQSHCPWTGPTVYFDCGGSSGANRLSYASGWSANRLVIMGYICSTTNSIQQIWENGVSKASDATGHTVNTVSYPIIGATGTGTEFDACAVGEMIIINGTVTTANRQKIEGYLAWKWALVGNLDAGHPYKLNPPRV